MSVGLLGSLFLVSGGVVHAQSADTDPYQIETLAHIQDSQDARRAALQNADQEAERLEQRRTESRSAFEKTTRRRKVPRTSVNQNVQERPADMYRERRFLPGSLGFNQ
ncbi:hypothetical protein [Saccharibacter sp. 17.LH.SD]|uniref:hypothetical protein n=1 Tax=Saccharibacter sp. 17.LH.SD TaxID=2689393 RepID=UPI001F22F76A|nr:hypothetical protein [Saccharibacter sp. 17.LH.SD]